MDAVWELAGKIGLFFLNNFIKDLAQRAALKESYTAFIKNRGSRVDQTVEIKHNTDEQSDDLDELQKKLEAEAKAKGKK